ncbi:MAG: phage major capsid protein [Endomicrobium sp.]|jgi:hypothetical protein|nr:phage major capsid protein [Endomicrobium sp.]
MASDLFNDLLVTTLSHIQPTLYSNIMKATPFMRFMFERGRMVTVKSGTKIEAILASSENQNVGWTTMGAILPTSRNAVLTRASYDWKYMDCTVTIYNDEISMNRTPEGILNLLKAELEVQETSCKNTMASSLFSNGSNPLQIGGLQQLIADNPATGVVGNIDRATNSWWRNKSIALSESPTADELKAAMNQMVLWCSIDTDRPGIIVMDENYYALYESTLQTIQRIVSSNKGDSGYQSIDFKGIPVIYDSNCPANHAYFVNDKYLKMAVGDDGNFKLQPARQPVNQLAYVYILHFRGNMILTNSDRQGVIFSAAETKRNNELPLNEPKIIGKKAA